MHSVTEERARCPFCGERITLLVDTSPGSHSYIEDCQVCCRPIEVVLDVDNGELLSLETRCAS